MSKFIVALLLASLSACGGGSDLDDEGHLIKVYDEVPESYLCLEHSKEPVKCPK